MVPTSQISIAVLIPCKDESLTVAAVVQDFHRELPASTIYVYDNNSTDKTKLVAQEAGAIVRSEPFQGKGYAVYRMFADIEADIYVLVDGDSTYDAKSSTTLIEHLLVNHCDMVTGYRVHSAKEAYRFGHHTGNRLLTGIVRSIFGVKIEDMLSGYRVFSRRFVKSFPMDVSGFELETMLTVHACEMHMKTGELPTEYLERPIGSVSKLNTIADGWRILTVIGLLIKELRPLTFFSTLSVIFGAVSLAIGVPVILEFLETGLVDRFPTAILSASVAVLAFLSLISGIILSSVAISRKETKRLAYLSIPWLGNRKFSNHSIPGSLNKHAENN
jgi:glycosyltransferase involved in cell wall biosynthesis